MKNNQYRLLPEWAPQKAVVLAWPHKNTDWAYMLKDAQHCFCEIACQISKRADVIILAPDIEEPQQQIATRGNLERMFFLKMPTNDTWARDFGPICTINCTGEVLAIDFRFNGWGLKFPANKDNCINSRLLVGNNGITFVPEAKYAMMQQLVLEGGSIDIDDGGTLLTTSECLLSPNRNPWLSQKQIEAELVDCFGLTQVVWLEHGALEGDDTDSHIDTLARFLPGKMIACATCDREDDSHYEDLQAMHKELEDKLPDYALIDLPIPYPIYDADGNRLPATYANFLIINGAVLLPVYGDEKYDTLAIQRLRAALPGYEIVPVNCKALIQQHGSLHCVTMQLPFTLKNTGQ